MEPQTRCTAFEGSRLIASGPLGEVAAMAKAVADRPHHAPILIFDDGTAEIIEIDFRGADVNGVARLAAAATAAPLPDQSPPRGPGRPKLGVVAREVTLLPRHWEWLGGQPGGASVTLRKLVEQARRANEERDRLRLGRDALYRFISVIASNAPDFEEATRALFAGNRARFEAFSRAWPTDVRDHAIRMSERAFEAEVTTPGA